MKHRGAFGVSAGADGGQHRGDAGADILAEEDVNRTGQTDEAAGGQGLQMPTEAEEDWMTAVKSYLPEFPKKRVAELGHQVNEGFGSRRALMAELIISMPINRMPRPAIIWP